MELAHPRTTTPGDTANGPEERRGSLVRAAFEAVAEDGFEGLRTRTVAARAGVNIATLHYYFPSKEALIGGVAQYLSNQFISLHGATPEPSGNEALDRLRQEFSDIRFYRAKHRDLLIVMLELQLRARRDQAIANIMDPLLEHFRDGLEKLVRDGVKDGSLQPDLDPEDAARVLMLAFMGTATAPISAKNLDGVFAELERWLIAPATKPAKHRGQKQGGPKQRGPKQGGKDKHKGKGNGKK
jgi:AcrR family transcriptional regulator